LKGYTEEEFREYYKNEYCRKKIMTFDGIRVYFKECSFNHAFYESKNRDGQKNTFSFIRAERMDWIRAALENRNARLLQGWDKKRRRYDPSRRVCVVFNKFVVILQMRLKRNGVLEAEFITCYWADNSIGKIVKSPKWLKEDCLSLLNKKGR